MKKFLPLFSLSLLLLFFAANTVLGQTNVSLKINHKLGEVNFAFDTEATNNMNYSFNVERLEYYMSGFTLFHDGTSTAIPDLHFLVRADEETVLDLGNFNVENINEIRFHIGVDESVNHEDPSSLSADNPLSPQFPSMHWGWAAGYRFIAMEGKSGAALTQTFELHGLGDDNYLETRKTVTPSTTTEGVLIELDADYTRVIENMNIDGGVISHGETGEAKTALENMKNYVFSQTATSTDIVDDKSIRQLDVFPNPTADGKIQITIETLNTEEIELQLFRIDGSLLSTQKLVGQTAIMQLDTKGLYFLRVLQNGKTVGYQKITAQ